MSDALAPIPPSAVTRHADTDAHLIALWLHGRSPHTQRAYAADATRFLDFAGRPLGAVTLGDLQDFADALALELAPSSVARSMKAIKSLLGFGHRLGYLPFDVGKAYKLPKHRDHLADRILEEPATHRLLALEPDPRNRLILRLLYGAGVRVSELCALTWADVQPRDDAAQLNVYGKGEKLRHVLIPPALARDLLAVRGGAGADTPVFRSRKGGRLDPSAVYRIVRAAADRAGIDGNVSPHWLRHSHATHAIERGAPVHLVAATLGHANIATTGRYLHARPSDSSSRYLAV